MSQSDVLLSELEQGNEQAFETVFRTHYARVFAVAYRLLGSQTEADDVAQEAFLRLYMHPLASGREHNLLAWLLRVATNLGYNALRSRRRREENESRALPSAVPPGPAEAADRAHVAIRVRQVLSLLPQRQVQLLLLRHDGLSYAEIAEALGVAPGSIGTLLARAERAFRDRYGELEEREADVHTDELS